MNLARTPETIDILNDSSFSKGLKFAIGGRSANSLSWGGVYKYNVYADLKVFRRAVNKHGLGFNVKLIL
jgi:hypothetical protein